MTSPLKSPASKKGARRRKVPRTSGTKEWASKNLNILLGCEHRCLYCYARWMAQYYGRIKSYEEWGDTYYDLREEEVVKARHACNGTWMFPTTHDITPRYLDACVRTLHNLLGTGDRVLIVTKPHLTCTTRLCQEFAARKAQILYRFTIGAMDDSVLAFWDTNAPGFRERFACLKHAYRKGFETSVSIEPMLDPPNVVRLFHRLKPYVTHSIWLGKMKDILKRVQPRTADEELACERIKSQQSNENIRDIFGQIKDEPLVRWKDSIKRVMGLKLSRKAGTDQ